MSNFFNVPLLAFFLTSLLLFSCGSNDDDTDTVPQEEQEKSIFNVWTERSGFTFDFSRASFNAPTKFTIFSRSRADLCGCTIVFLGNESNGTIQMSSCNYIGPDPSPPESICKDFENHNRPYSYQKVDATLVICVTNSNCHTLH